ncbi:serine/threonine-protein kinase pim-2 isoform X1 [Danio rerio]|uniref:Serine/threonine-protein kinase pim-2 isoform X1 n=2 Tax=Danio rerio TaxID=7955 RepID=A0AC58I0R0_DANRE
MTFLCGQKRKRSCHSSHVNDFHPHTPPISITSLQSSDVAEENERKRRRTDSPEKLLSCKVQKSSSSSSQEDQTSVQIHKKSSEGDILDRYELGKEIGEGGFGSVYEGKRLEDGLEVAVKIARKPSNMKYINIAGHPEPLPLEIGLLILAHRGGKVPEIIELLDWQDQQDRYIMILERPSPCVDLFDFIMSLGSITERQAQKIMEQATTAGLMCCRRGVFHRDIKLENLLVNTDTLEVKLIDFGCGALLQESGYDSFCGTKEYFPPEYYLDDEYHAEPSTVWSLGVLLFLLLCQRFPEVMDTQRIDDGNWTEPGLSEGQGIRNKECSANGWERLFALLSTTVPDAKKVQIQQESLIKDTAATKNPKKRPKPQQKNMPQDKILEKAQKILRKGHSPNKENICK